jgi:hypothetical protein
MIYNFISIRIPGAACSKHVRGFGSRAVGWGAAGAAGPGGAVSLQACSHLCASCGM